jgi:hypothetical protein
MKRYLTLLALISAVFLSSTAFAGDYNGDGQADFAVVREVISADGNAVQWQWIIDTNMDGVADIRVNYGLVTDNPFPADYDGDGITDFAVIRGVGDQLQWIVDTNRDGVADIKVDYGLRTDRLLP